jgi:hypothetical protein
MNHGLLHSAHLLVLRRCRKSTVALVRPTSEQLTQAAGDPHCDLGAGKTIGNCVEVAIRMIVADHALAPTVTSAAPLVVQQSATAARAEEFSDAALAAASRSREPVTGLSIPPY